MRNMGAYIKGDRISASSPVQRSRSPHAGRVIRSVTVVGTASHLDEESMFGTNLQPVPKEKGQKTVLKRPLIFSQSSQISSSESLLGYWLREAPISSLQPFIDFNLG